MPSQESRFVNLCPVFITNDIRKTVQFYTEKLGFKSAKHYDKVENFATLYRDEIEFVIVQARHGEVTSNAQRYGAGFDAYIDTATPEGIEEIYKEFKAQGVNILAAPHGLWLVRVCLRGHRRAADWRGKDLWSRYLFHKF